MRDIVTVGEALAERDAAGDGDRLGVALSDMVGEADVEADGVLETEVVAVTDANAEAAGVFEIAPEPDVVVEAEDEIDVLSDGVGDVEALSVGVSVPDALCEREGLAVALFDVVAEAVAEGEGGGAESATTSVEVSARA